MRGGLSFRDTRGSEILTHQAGRLKELALSLLPSPTPHALNYSSFCYTRESYLAAIANASTVKSVFETLRFRWLQVTNYSKTLRVEGNLLENVERKSCVTPRPRPGASVTMVSGSQENSISTDVLVVSSMALKMEIFVKCMKVKWQNNWKHLALKWLSRLVDHCYNRRSENGSL